MQSHRSGMEYFLSALKSNVSVRRENRAKEIIHYFKLLAEKENNKVPIKVSWKRFEFNVPK